MSPPVGLAELSLFPANRQQTIESRRRTHPQWSRGLSMEVYLRRDERLDELEHAKDGRMTTWVLAPRDDPQTLDFLCACETYRRDALFVKSADQQTNTITAYAIASVFTPIQYRKHGYASHMMSLLHWVLGQAEFRSQQAFPDAWGAPPFVPDGHGDGWFSVLYSDIGPTFYAQASPCGRQEGQVDGWVVDKPSTTVIPVTSTSAYASASLSQAWSELDSAACEATWEEDIKLMADDMSSTSVSGSTSSVAFKPTRGVAATQIQRTMEPISGELPFNTWGFRLQHTSGTLTYATWTLELYGSGPKRLVATRLRASSQDHFMDLIARLLDTAREVGAEELELWNLPHQFQTLVSQTGGLTEERDEHLASIKFYLDPSAQRPEWLFNERFAWC